jgi:hypothetical protein
MEKLFKRYWHWAVAILLGLMIIAAPIQNAAAPSSPAMRSNLLKIGNICSRAISAEEKRSGIPHKLLYAVSIKETGRWVKERQANIAWPWTVNAGGDGHHFKTKADAIRHVRKLKKQGQKNIDVGCMQINLHYHPNAFRSLEAGFNPQRNIAYAAKFLVALKNSHGSWEKAVRHYHSSRKARNLPYQKKVFSIWKAELAKPHSQSVAAAVTTEPTAKRSGKPSRPTKSARVAARKVEKAHRMLLAELRKQFPNRFGTPNRSGKPVKEKTATRFLANWPPRNYAAQQRTENLARSYAFSKRRRHLPRKLAP